jgi:hypothetical protein
MALCPHGYTLNWDCPICEQPTVCITVSRETRDLLAAHVTAGCRLVGELWRHDGRVDLLVDSIVFAHLEAIDPNPDIAIRKLCASKVGHA